MTDIIAPGAVSNGVQTTNATTRVALTAGVCRTVVVKALNTNTGLVYVGNATVAAANGFRLAASEQVALSISNRNLVYFDVAVNGEGVCWISVA
jgi:hypothetical protein